jgi:integrase/recombinase XerD
MTMKLSTTLIHLDTIPNPVNASLVKEFYEYLKQLGTSENYENQNLKQIINFARYLGAEKTMSDVKSKDDIVTFLNTKMKDAHMDPDKK